MKRLGSSDSFGGLISIFPSTEEKSQGNDRVHGRGFQSMLEGFEEEDGLELEESAQVVEKKRRLSIDQVKALEKNFEVENKLEPERKVKLAQELGLQPRQVAVWFQNRRARWKTKQLERDYALLKTSYDDLKASYKAIQRDKEVLLADLRELKAKVQNENTQNNILVKEEMVVSESENKVIEHGKISDAAVAVSEKTRAIHDCYANSNGGRVMTFGDFKDGSSDSDSSAILNEDNSPNAAISSSGVLQKPHQLMSPTSSLRFNCSSSSSPSSINCFQFSASRAGSAHPQKAFQHPFGRILEEHNFFDAEDSCDFFSDDQAPTLPWYCPDQWN